LKNIFCIKPKGFNVGNDAIFTGMEHFLFKTLGEKVNLISLPATSRYESHNNAGLVSSTIHQINQFGHGVIVGGGNLYENGELDIDLNALNALTAPLMIFSVSYGRIYDRKHQLVQRTDAMSDEKITAINEKAFISLSRDHSTHNYLKELGCSKSQFGGCPTIFLDRMVPKLISPSKRTGYVLLSIRNPNLMNIPLNKQAEVRGDILGIIDFLQRQGHHDIRLLCHDHRDISFAASFTGMEYIYTGDVHRYFSILQNSSLNISYRLHATLPCMAFGVPSIKISYDERAISLMNSLGLGEWNIEKMNVPSVLDAVKDRYQRLDSYKVMLSELGPEWEKIYTNFQSSFQQFADEVIRRA
jgi:polysaccharide pyruvyl transferase WcaK-like protein